MDNLILKTYLADILIGCSNPSQGEQLGRLRHTHNYQYSPDYLSAPILHRYDNQLHFHQYIESSTPGKDPMIPRNDVTPDFLDNSHKVRYPPPA